MERDLNKRWFCSAYFEGNVASERWTQDICVDCSVIFLRNINQMKNDARLTRNIFLAHGYRPFFFFCQFNLMSRLWPFSNQNKTTTNKNNSNTSKAVFLVEVTNTWVLQLFHNFRHKTFIFHFPIVFVLKGFDALKMITFVLIYYLF